MESSTNSSSPPSLGLGSLPKLVSHLKLLPLIESCEAVWPSRLDLQLMAPSYETNLQKLRLLLECDPSQLVQESTEPDVLNLQVSFITCCYESTAFMLSEELAAELQTLREAFVWSKLMVLATSRPLISKVFQHYRRMLLAEDWFYQFGDLTSFCAFVWDLVAFDQDEMRLLDRTAMELIEQICFRLLRSKKVQLFVKGVTVLEECIHKARGHSLVDYESVYKELGKQAWRLAEEDERIQNASIILLTGMLECVRVLEVDRNQLMTLISNFSQLSRADELMEILLKGLNQSNAVGTSIALLDILLQLLAIDHDGLRVVPDESAEEYNPDEMVCPLIMTNGNQKIDTRYDDWWKDIIDQNKGRFHRWTMKLFRMLLSEIGKFENFNVTHYQYLCYTVLFSIHCEQISSLVQIGITHRTMVSFANRMVNRLESLMGDTSSKPIDSTLRSCMHLITAVVACVKNTERFVPAVGETRENDVTNLGNYQSQCLNKLLSKVQEW
nr:uncharacterized protein LOC109422612 [Aedes albopictus]